MLKIKKNSFFALCFTLIFATSLSSKNLVFGVVPQQSSSQLTKNWTPIVKFLSDQSGLNISLRIEKSIEEFLKNLYDGKYDIAYMSPYHYVVAHEKQGFTAKFRSSEELVGILVARDEIEMRAENFRNREYLFPDPNAFAATLLTKYELKKYFATDIEKSEKITYVNSHDSVYKALTRGIGDIGGGIERTFNNMSDKESKSKLKIIHRTKAYPSHPIAYSKKVDPLDTKLLDELFLKIPKELLKVVNMENLIKTEDHEYDAIRDVIKNMQIKR